MSYKPSPKQALLLWRLIAAETEAEREPMVSDARPELTREEREQLVRYGLVDLEKRGRGLYYILTDRAWVTAAETLDVEILKSRSTIGAEALQGVLRMLLAYAKHHEIPLASIFSHRPRKAIDATSQPVSSRKSKSTPHTKARSKRTRSTAAKPRTATTTPAKRTPSTKVKSQSATNAKKTPLAKARPRPPAKAPSTNTPSHKARPGPVTKAAREGNGLTATIEQACVDLAGGARKHRVRLTALRKKLGSVGRDALDAALLELQDQGRLVLYRDDNTSALTEADHDAALIVGNAPRHLVYLEA